MPITTTGAGVFAVIAGGGSTTTFNAASLQSGDVVLSNGDLTATNSQAVAGFSKTVAAFAAHSTGLYYYELHADAASATALQMAGIGISGAQTFIGSDSSSIGWASDGTVYFNSGALSTIQTWAVGNTLCVAVDFGNNRIWFRTNGGNWNNSGIANPATNTGGLDISGKTAGAYTPMVSFRSQNDAFTANFGGSSYAQTAPIGFGNW